MSKSTALILTAAGIAGGNEWFQTNKIPWRIGIAGLIGAFLFDGIEKLNETAGVGLSIAVLITAAVTPFHGNSPVEELNLIISNSGKVPGGTRFTYPISGTGQPPGTARHSSYP